VAGALRERLARIRTGDELGIALVRGLVVFSADPAELAGFLAGRPLPAGVPLDPELGWRIRYRLAVLGALEQAGIDAALAAAPTGLGQEWAARCRAARPDPETKAACWQEIMHGSSSSYELWALAEGFWQPEQAALTAPYAGRFFTELRAAAEGRGDLVLDLLIRSLYPRFAAGRDTLALAGELAAGDGEGAVTLTRRIGDHTDDLRRVVEVRERA
jgi:aminopeptidase N